MANKFKGELAAKTEDGREYTLKLRMGVLAAFETETGKKALDVLNDEGFMSINDALVLTYHALKPNHPDATRDDAEELLSDNVSLIMDLIAACDEGNAKAPAGKVKKPPARR